MFSGVVRCLGGAVVGVDGAGRLRWRSTAKTVGWRLFFASFDCRCCRVENPTSDTSFTRVTVLHSGACDGAAGATRRGTLRVESYETARRSAATL